MALIRSVFDHVAPFLSVVEQGSFTRAARVLGVSPTAVSKSVRALEDRVGQPLFQRTTRKVALTEAGIVLHEHMAAAARHAESGIAAVAAMGGVPTGILRLTIPTTALIILRPVIAHYQRLYPSVLVDLSVSDAMVDLIAEGFDAGVRLGPSIEKDMIAVRISQRIRWSIIASPSYLEQHGTPERLEDLTSHDGLFYRFSSAGSVHRWQFSRNGTPLEIEPRRCMIVDDLPSLISIAVEGAGLAFVPSVTVEDQVRRGEIIRLFEDDIPPDDGLFLYFPVRMQRQPKLRAFIDLTVRQMQT